MNRSILLPLLALVGLWMLGGADAATLTVDDDGPGPYTAIQPAIDDADPGDIVFVMPGVYTGAIVMKDEVNLIGYGPHVTTIDGEGVPQHVVTFNGSVGAVISGFRIIGSQISSVGGSWHFAGVYCQVGPLVIRNNIIENNKSGIAVETDGRPTIVNNTILNNDAAGIIFAAGAGPYEPPVRIAFIYDVDRDGATAYAALLERRGYDVDLIALGDLLRRSLQGYRAILIGHDTEREGCGWPSKEAAYIAESGKPVLAMGEGGYDFLGQLQLNTGCPHGAHSDINTDMVVIDRSHILYHYPNTIPIPKSGQIGVYEKSGSVEIYLDPVPRNVEVWGRYPDQVGNHYLLTRENGRYAFWGFTGNAKSLTELGADLLENVIRYVSRACYPNLPSPELVATGGEVLPDNMIRYGLRVDNWYVYPSELFDPISTGPCGSRTDVDIYAEGGERLYGFCALGSPEGLTDLWFGYPADQEPPSVYITLTDRLCGTVWESNLVTPTLEPRVTHVIMNNIIASNNTGLFYYAYTGDGQILYNDVWGNSYRNYHDNHTGSTFVPQPGTGEISADPLFDPAYPETYILTDVSPCKNTGNPAPAYNDPDGTRNDMGVWGGPGAGGPGSHPGGGFIFTDVGNLPTAFIEQNPGHPSHGLAVIDPVNAAKFAVPTYQDSPFGGTLRIYGLFGEEDIHVRGVRYYQILIAPWPDENTPPAEPDDYEPITSALYKVHYLPQGDGTVLTEVVHIGAKEVGGVKHVYELTYTGWWSAMNLRVLLDTRSLPNGKYTLTYRAYRPVGFIGGTILLPVTLPANDLDHLDILVNNSPVEAVIHSVKYDPGNPNYDPGSDGEIPECGVITLQDPEENLRFTITARHPDGYLRYWVLDALWGKNHHAGVIASQSYPGTIPPDNWPGVVNTEFDSADSTSLDPWEACSYQFRLRAYTRATNGQGYLYGDPPGYSAEFNDHYYIGFAACGWCNGADINRSGRVDLADFARLAAEWMNDCAPDCAP